MITYLKHHQIDYKRWDDAIIRSPNGLVYSLTWYLDMVSPGWEALVEGDYEYVMPLPVKHKFWLPYLAQPAFTQQLGLFSFSPITSERVQEFLNAIPRKFLKVHYNLNSSCNLNLSGKISFGVNYELLLSKTYENLYSGFNENTKRNIKKAAGYNLSLQTLNTEGFVQKCKLEKNGVSEKVFEMMDRLLERAKKEQAIEIYGVCNEKGEVIAGTAFIKSINRIFYLVSFSFEEGKEKSAMFLLVDYMIKKYSNSGYVLDFEGSVIPGIARFFAGFGAIKTSYPVYRRGF